MALHDRALITNRSWPRIGQERAGRMHVLTSPLRIAHLFVAWYQFLCGQTRYLTKM